MLSTRARQEAAAPLDSWLDSSMQLPATIIEVAFFDCQLSLFATLRRPRRVFCNAVRRDRG
jgi:hypothetical protein